MDEVHRRLVERNFARRFACFTLDDGYRDNRDFALPVLREFDAPSTVYVASDFAEGTGRLWWIALETVIAKADARSKSRSAALPPASIPRRRPPSRRRSTGCTTGCAGCRASMICSARSSALCTRHGVDEAAICRELCMSWDELKPFADDPLVTIGAHTITHCNLARQTEEIAAHEMAASRARIEDALQRPVAASRLSLWRPDRGRRPRIRAGARRRLQDRGDDAAGHDLSRERRRI